MMNIILKDIETIEKKINTKFLNKKKILIFGASGIIGIYFLFFFYKQLHKKNRPKKITLISKNKLPFYFNFLRGNKKIVILESDVKKINFNKIEKQNIIIFAGGYGQPSKFLENPIETIELNTSILINFLNKLSKNGKFLYLSSSEVYNKNEKINLSEEKIGLTNTDDVRSPYIEAKRCGETIVNTFINKKKIDAKSIRLSLAYGPGVKKDDGRVLNQFIQRSLKDNMLFIQDGGKAIRKYIYISDAIRMMLNVLIKGKRKVYNICGTEKITIAQLGFKIGKILNIPVKTKKDKPIKGSPKIVSLSLKRYRSEFKMEPMIKIKQGLKNTIEWYKKLYQA